MASQIELKQRFMEQARIVIDNTPNDPQKVPVVGLEVELYVTKNGFPSSNEFVKELKFAEVELGTWQIELQTDKTRMDTIKKLHDELNEKQRLLKAHAKDMNIIRIGAAPNINIDKITTTNKPRYNELMEFYRKQKRYVKTKVGGIDFKDPNCVSLFFSTQFNTQADSLSDAVDKVNRSLMIAPYIVAASGNARIINRQDTKIDDIRMMAWGACYDLRNSVEIKAKKEVRVGLPYSYFKSIYNYFECCVQFPFALKNPEDPFKTAIGMYWLDARIKFLEGIPIVEFRPMSVQPSAREDIAFALFYIGRLAYSQKTSEQLIKLATVNRNRNSAMQNGLRGKLVSEGRLASSADAVANELKKAEEGLEMLGYKQKEFAEYVTIIRDRIKKRKTPAQVFAEKIKTKPIEEVLLEYQI